MELRPERIASLFAKGEPPLVNIGGGEELSIAELAHRVRHVIGADIAIAWDATKPDGTPQKALDSRRLTDLGWRPSISFDAGLRDAYADFLAQRVRA